MDALLADPETRTLWSYFLQLSAIPRESQHEQAAAAWVAEQGRLLDCDVAQDAAGNVRIRKAASPGLEGRPCLAVQAHVDMVCARSEDSAHDFATDPLDLVLEGDLLGARGTSLGADNGIGVAAALALLADPGPAHGPLEALITVDEEKDLTGARSLAPGWLQAAYLVNLDGDGQGILTIGGAGRLDTIASRPISLEAPAARLQAHRLEVTGLKGGHSGLEIHRGRANALRLLAQVLWWGFRNHPLRLGALACVNPRNALPREAAATVLLPPEDESAFRAELSRAEAHWRTAYGLLEPELALRLTPWRSGEVLAEEDARRLLDLLLALPHGVEAMSPGLRDLPQTSTNLASARIENSLAQVILMTRSALEDSKYALRDRIEAACSLAGFHCWHENDNPGWRPDPGSPFAKLVAAAYEAVSGQPMLVSAIHADLECSQIGLRHPGLQMVSISPDMWGTHTPHERLSVTSSNDFRRFLLEIVARVARAGD